ncbi:hypothetical protein [Kitasatospora sp. NPDC005856]|uniref:hypothetical protein n=1 Tax=Kitasatospora sp. NPDC005856 TaxID=3154566 RepID=UPI0033D7FFA3
MAATTEPGPEAGLVARRLRTGDAEAAARLCSFEDVDAAVVERELAAPDDYCWMGLFRADGTPAAVHRGMRWHRHLLLKGVFVDDGHRGVSAAVGAAFAIRDWARQAGYAGVLAWMERNKPEAQLAARLRIRPVGPLLHRFLVPLPAAGDAAGSDTAPSTGSGLPRPGAGTLTVPLPGEGAPAVGELLGIEQDDPDGTRVGWILDRSRLVLSGNPCRSVDDLKVLRAAAAQTAAATGATALEVLFEAADLLTALSLAKAGVKRLSRSPVNLGVLHFESRSVDGSAVERRAALGRSGAARP